MPSGLKGPDMDFVFWIILIVLIVGIVWWLLNRGSSTKTTADDGRAEARPAAPAQDIRADGALAGGSAAASAEAAGTSGIATAAGFGRPSEPVPPTTADDASELPEPSDARRAGERDSSAPERMDAEPATASAEPMAAPAPPAARNADDLAGAPASREVAGAAAAPGENAAQGTGEAPRTSEARGTDDQVEWETQWSEAGGSPAHHAAASSATAPTAGTADTADTKPVQAAGSTAAGQAAPIHHPEYTEPHSPTLPGAESAAAELGIEEPAATATTGSSPLESSPVESSPLESSPVESSPLESSPAGSETEPSGHLAADRPYGEGSASPSPDGSGPADYTVKGDADSMVYYEEGHPEYEQTRAGVWFESAAHAEAAGFRAPRRTRLQ